MVVVLVRDAKMAVRRVCEVCGGPKPRGKGVRRCEQCRPPEATTRQCRRCGDDRPLDDYVRKGTTCIACRETGFPSRWRKCMRCFTELPPTAFPWSDGRQARGQRPGERKRRRVCKECVAREHADRAQRREKRRTTWVDPHTGRLVRRCSPCGEIKDLERDFYNTINPEKQPDWTKRKAYVCKGCTIKRTGAYFRRIMADPVTRAEYRAKHAGWRRAWRNRNRERDLESHRRWWQRMMADPERHRRYLESVRLGYHLRKERRGEQSRPRNSAQRPAAEEGFSALPAFPLGDAVCALAEREGIDFATACARMETPERTVFAWVQREREIVQFDVADRALTRLDLFWWEVWPPDAYPDVQRIFEGDQ